MKFQFKRLAAGVALVCASSFVAAAAKPATEMACGKPMTADQKIQKNLDYLEINNIAAAHEYWHSALKHKEEIDYAWSKRDDISWTNNTDKYSNRKSVLAFYVDGMKGVNPKGALWYHMLTTPFVQIAGDGKTAKAIWMSFGNVTGQSPDGKSGSAQWTQEKYAMDLIKEDGKWKIWHLRTYVDFYTDIKKSWIDDNLAAPHLQSADGAGVKEEPGVSFEMAKPDIKGNFYEGYHINRIPVLNPDMPQPYCTFSEVKPY